MKTVQVHLIIGTTLDANNLYGWAMIQKLPTGGFKWIDKGATVIGLSKNWPVKFRSVIFGLLPDANEVWRHICQISKNITGQ